MDLTEKGWFITYIDRDPETIERERRKERKMKAVCVVVFLFLDFNLKQL